MTTPHEDSHQAALRRCVAAVIAAEERDALRVARDALSAAHALLIAASMATSRPPGPLMEAAVAVGEALEALEDEQVRATGGERG